MSRRAVVTLVLGAAVALAFALDTLTTVWAAESGGQELNPLAPAPPSSGYLWFSLLRAALALALLGLLPAAAASQPRRRVGRVVLWGLGALVAVKLGAAASNGWLLMRGAALLSTQAWPAWALLVAGGLIAGEGVARWLAREEPAPVPG